MPGFEELTDTLNELQSELDKIRTPVAQMAANELQKSERNAMQHHNKTRKMWSSIDYIPNGEGSFIVGATAHSDNGFPYPLSIENGRREVRPVNPGVKFLHWVDNGQNIFAKRSRAVKADPYVQKGIDNSWGPIEAEIDKMIGGLG